MSCKQNAGNLKKYCLGFSFSGNCVYVYSKCNATLSNMQLGSGKLIVDSIDVACTAHTVRFFYPESVIAFLSTNPRLTSTATFIKESSAKSRNLWDFTQKSAKK